MKNKIYEQNNDIRMKKIHVANGKKLFSNQYIIQCNIILLLFLNKLVFNLVFVGFYFLFVSNVIFGAQYSRCKVMIFPISYHTVYILYNTAPSQFYLLFDFGSIFNRCSFDCRSKHTHTHKPFLSIAHACFYIQEEFNNIINVYKNQGKLMLPNSLDKH